MPGTEGTGEHRSPIRRGPKRPGQVVPEGTGPAGRPGTPDLGHGNGHGNILKRARRRTQASPDPEARLREILDGARGFLSFDQPGLVARIEGAVLVIEGDHLVGSSAQDDAAGGPLARHAIRLTFDADFPSTPAVLFESNGTIPRDPDHHVNPDGSCCFGIWEAIHVRQPDLTLQDLLEGPVRSYFIGQAHKAATGAWPFGELAHGQAGVVEECAEILGCPADPDLVIGLLRVMSGKWRRDRKPCACGSGKRLRACCRPRLQSLSRQLSHRQAQRLLNRLA